MGDGSYRDRCEKFGTVIGMVDDVQSRLSDADFVCANSYLSIFEAQAQTKVVLSLYSNSLKESYLKKFPGASAMLIASSAEELNLKLTNLLSNKSHLLQLQTAAQKVAETFSWKKVASIYENIAYRL
jgi:glycosyltransferase involved in cell wall biosynthesis